MIEVAGDLWTLPTDDMPTLRLITTNGQTRTDNAAVMGRGCARQARERLPALDHKLGALITQHGNRVMRLCALDDGSHLASFPVKYHWREPADLALIETSAHQLVDLADKFGYTRVYLPRPGMGAGRLDYDSAVRPVLERILTDERFAIVNYPSTRNRGGSRPPIPAGYRVRSSSATGPPPPRR